MVLNSKLDNLTGNNTSSPFVISTNRIKQGTTIRCYLKRTTSNLSYRFSLFLRIFGTNNFSFFPVWDIKINAYFYRSDYTDHIKGTFDIYDDSIFSKDKNNCWTYAYNYDMDKKMYYVDLNYVEYKSMIFCSIMLLSGYYWSLSDPNLDFEIQIIDTKQPSNNFIPHI